MIEDNQILFAMTFPQVLFNIHIDGLVLDISNKDAFSIFKVKNPHIT